MEQEWIEKYVAQHPSAGTRRMYASDLRDLAEFLDRHPTRSLLQVSESTAVAWRAELELRGLKPSTIARKLAVGRGLFAYLQDVDPPIPGLPGRNPFRRVRAPRFDRSVRKTPCPAPEEVRRLLRAIGRRTPRARRDLLMALLLFNQGLRISEVARLQRSSIRTQGAHVYLSIVGKGGAEIRSVLGEEAARLLSRHLKSLPAGQRHVFTRMGAGGDRPLEPRTVRAALRRYVLRAGLDPAPLRPHSGRVFFITQAYLRTRDLERVARAVGHRELATTRRYLRLGAALDDHPAKLLNLLSV